MIAQLGEKYPETWGIIPRGLFVFAQGGINSTGACCGIFVAHMAVLRQMGAPTAVIQRYLRYFENASFPTNAAYIDYRSGNWIPGGNATGGWGTASNQLLPPLNNAPRIKTNGVTCHGALTRWKIAASSWLAVQGSGAVQDRCTKATYDATFWLCNLINDWKAGVTITDPGDAVVAGCKTPACHGSTSATSGTPPTGVQGNITCVPCHSSTAGVTPGHGM